MADGTAIDLFFPEFLEEDLSFDDGWRDPANVLAISDTSIRFFRLSRRGRSDIVISGQEVRSSRSPVSSCILGNQAWDELAVDLKALA